MVLHCQGCIDKIGKIVMKTKGGFLFFTIKKMILLFFFYDFDMKNMIFIVIRSA